MKVFVRLIILFMLFIPTMVSAEDYDYSTGALEEDDVSEQEVLEAQLEEQKADKEIETFFRNNKQIPKIQISDKSEIQEVNEFFGNHVIDENSAQLSRLPDGEWYSIWMVARKQINGYYCGPAAVQQNLSFHKNSSKGLPSQKTIAKLAGTTKAGSSSYGLRNALNKYASTYKFKSKYVVGNVTLSQQGTWESRIKNNLITKRKAPILLYETRYLNRYKGRNIRHYNSIQAWSYNYKTGLKRVKSVDPHYSKSYFGKHWDNVGSSKKNGAFRSTGKAYRKGGNPNMVY